MERCGDVGAYILTKTYDGEEFSWLTAIDKARELRNALTKEFYDNEHEHGMQYGEFSIHIDIREDWVDVCVWIRDYVWDRYRFFK